jgi:hypothetical protein
MASEPISEMPNIGALESTDLIPIVRPGIVNNFTTTPANLAAFAGAGSYVSVTESASISALQSGTIFDNYGAAQLVSLVLPPWQVGLTFTFTIAVDEILEITPDGTDQLSANGELYPSLSSDQLYASLVLATSNLPGIWISRSIQGSWG